MSDFLYIDQKTRTNVEKTSQANISKDLFENYRIDRSLRFNSGDLATLTRTPASSGNRTAWTQSFWIKRGKLGTEQHFFESGGANFQKFFDVNDRFRWYENGDYIAITTQVFRDTSAWYHFVLTWDSANATAEDRFRIYVNGTRVTSFSTTSNPSSSQSSGWNQASTIHYFGRYNNNDNALYYFNGYLTEANFIDGQALTPSSFGFFDNQRDFTWKPKKYSGSYGNNGFYLNFSNNSSASLLGKDFSGNGNNWTPNNFSVTAGAGNDSLVDSPTNYGTDTGVGGEVRGNYCTMNPLYSNSGGSGTYSNGNLTFSIPNNGGGVASFSVSSGKWYWEGKSSANATAYGVRQSGTTDRYTNSIFYDSGGGKYISGTNIAYGSSWTTSDIIGVALDSDGGTITFYKNNVSQGSIALSTASITEAVPAIPSGGGFAHTGDINFGQRPFAYTAPTGFKALCTTNLTTPTIKKPSSYMDVVTYTGTGASNSISSLGFSPDLVWIKSRSNAYAHRLADTVRGAGKELISNQTVDESTNDPGGYLSAFNSNGFTLGTGVGVNGSSLTYVAWAWDETPIAGFNIISYTGNGANRTIAHNLGVAPKMLIVKARTTAGADQGWPVWHTSIANTTYLQLNSTAATATGTDYWNSTSPTSSVFSVGTNAAVNTSADTYIAYAFAEVEGFSKFGSYTGNGSTDGPFVYCGFRPRYFIIKRTDSTGGWWTWDSARNTFNAVNSIFRVNTTNAEDTDPTNYNIDFVSNGIKVRATSFTADGGMNVSGATYIFAAFAEAPFKNARAR